MLAGHITFKYFPPHKKKTQLILLDTFGEKLRSFYNAPLKMAFLLAVEV